MRDTTGAILYDTVQCLRKPDFGGTFVDPNTGNQTDASGVPLAGWS